MNVYSIKVTKTAKHDLQSISWYIASKLASPKAALNLVDMFEKQIENLGKNPECHPLVCDEFLATKKYRILPIKNYLVFYKIDYQSQVVNIVRVLYGRRDWINILC